MFANERQDIIWSMLQKDGAVTTAKLTEHFDVSVETARRDLLTMEKSGKLTRVHGGAVLKNDMKPYMALPQRNKEFAQEKYDLSRKAAEFIAEGDIIGVDSGSTATFFAEVLKERFSSLTCVTYSMDVFQTLCNHKAFSVILCGGNYLREENAFYGELALAALENLHVQKAFVFPSAVSLEQGIFDYQKDLYQLQKRLIRSADKTFMLADSSKFEKTGFLKLGDTQAEHIYVTDSLLPDEIARLYQENGMTVYMGGKK